MISQAQAAYILKTNFRDPVYRPYGNVEAFIYDKSPEVIASGPSNTGKTLGACWKVHYLACKYPGAQLAIIRQTQKSLYGSVLQTFERVIRGAPVIPYGGEKPEKYIYQHGSTVWVGGMDNPDKVLSSERDLIYVNQAEELSEGSWEMLTTRVTGRNAVMPYTQLIGDCNPSGSKHWIPRRHKDSLLKLIPTVFKDNPTLYDPVTGQLTELGKRTLDRLGNLTGIRRKRLFEGIWATAEGAIYDNYDPSIHVKYRDPAEFRSWYLAMDEGYKNPAVILLVGQDPDKRLHIAREFHKSYVLQAEVVRLAQLWSLEMRVSDIAVDAAAAGLIADLQDLGLPAYPAKGRVKDGISKVRDYLQVQGDGKPRLTMDPDCKESQNEFESYIWKPDREEPVKENDHIPDAIRYLIDLLDRGELDVF